MLTRIAVVVPAHDEEQLLPACLDALGEAARSAPLPVDVLVVLDSCRDGSSRVAAAAGVDTLAVDARNVGRARAAGASAVLSGTGTWLACTDADTRVAPDWFVQQLRLAEAGADVVTGIVQVDDWTDWPPGTESAFGDAYRRNVRGARHEHVHGANLGLTGAAYRLAGGFPPVPVDEDQALIRAALDAGLRIVRSSAVRVVTSARRHGRAPEGFSAYLRTL